MRARQHDTADPLNTRHRADTAMSNFVTTMFVSISSSFAPSFPAKPKVLRPISTFAQSQSCMNLWVNMDMIDCQEYGMAGHIHWASEEVKPGATEALAKPKEIYQSPL